MIGRKRERKNGAVPKLAGQAHRAAVRFDDGFGDRQAHSGSLHGVALVLAAIKFFENEALLGIVDAGAAVGDAGGDEIAVAIRR